MWLRVYKYLTTIRTTRKDKKRNDDSASLLLPLKEKRTEKMFDYIGIKVDSGDEEEVEARADSKSWKLGSNPRLRVWHCIAFMWPSFRCRCCCLLEAPWCAGGRPKPLRHGIEHQDEGKGGEGKEGCSLGFGETLVNFNKNIKWWKSREAERKSKPPSN